MESGEPTPPGIEPLADSDPRTAGPYRLLGRLGAGAMGRVYLGCRDGEPVVAVKVVRAELADQARYRKRFAREVEAVRRVAGARVAAVVDADPGARLPWVATDYVPGPSLGAAIAESGPWDSSWVRRLGAGIAEALRDIHAAGVVHRDLKPGNVLLSPDGPKVIDFGVARAADHAQISTSGRISGTPAYMSPEQLEATSLASPTADVFAFGALLAFAATGRPAFGGGRPLAILDRVVNGAPDLDGVAEDDAELRALIEACLDKDPANRPDVARVLAVCRGTAAAALDAEPPAPVEPILVLPDLVRLADVGPPVSARSRRRPSRRLIGSLGTAAVAATAAVAVIALTSGSGSNVVAVSGGLDRSLAGPSASPSETVFSSQVPVVASPSTPSPTSAIAAPPHLSAAATSPPGQVLTTPAPSQSTDSPAPPSPPPGPQTAGQLQDSQPAASPPAAGRVTQVLLGTPDFDAYCRAEGRTGAYLDSKLDDVYGWRCVGDGAAINPDDVCRRQFGGTTAVSRYQDFNDPNSWQCWD